MSNLRVDFSLRKEVSFVALSSILGAFVMFVPSTLFYISAGKEFYLSWLVFAKIVGSNSIIVGVLIHVVVDTIIGIISGIVLYRGKILNISKISNGMPKIPNMRGGVLTNAFPTPAKLKEINKTIAHDGKWHTIFEEPNQVHIDGITVRRRTEDSLT